MLQGREAETCCSHSFSPVTCPFGEKAMLHKIQRSFTSCLMKQGQHDLSFQFCFVWTALAKCPRCNIKKKTISAPARLMKINLSEGFAMVKFSLFLGFWGVFMMTMNNKNEKKEKRLRRVPRFAITFYGPVSVNLCSPACVLSPKCVNTKLEGACPLYSSSQHVLTTSPRNMST